MKSHPSARPRFHELDGLRAVAATLVVLTHTVPSSIAARLTAAGYGRAGILLSTATTSGVALFFVLSGVVLLRPYLRGKREFETGLYFRRRVQRILPPYLAALLFAGAVVLIVGLSPTWYSLEVLPPFSLAGLAAQAGIVNLGWTTYNGAWWSLSLEVIFYLIVPIVVVLLCRRRIPDGAMFVVTLLGFAGSIAVAWLGSPSTVTAERPVQVAQLFGVYVPTFAVGILIARRDFSARIGTSSMFLGSLWAGIALWLPQVNMQAGLAVFYGGVVVVAMYGRGRLREWLSRPTFIWLGERSYSLFLVHFSVLYLVFYAVSLFVPSRTMTYFLISRVIGLPLCILGAMTLFWFVERRFARGLVTGDAFWPWRLQVAGSGEEAPPLGGDEQPVGQILPGDD